MTLRDLKLTYNLFKKFEVLMINLRFHFSKFVATAIFEQ